MAARRTRKKTSRRATTTRSKAQREFVSEAEEILDRMRADAADLADRRAAGGGDDVDPELVNRLFRSAHSLKGLSGMFGLDGIGELAHRLEDVLDGLRLGRVPMDSPAVDLVDDAVALFAALLEGLGDPEAEQQGAEAATALIARIEQAMQAPTEPVSEFAGLDLEPALLRALTEYEEHRLRENVRRGRCIALADASFEIIAFEEGLAELTTAVREVGEVLSTLPSPGDSPESQIRFSLLVASELPAEGLAERLDLPREQVRAVSEPAGSAAAEPAPAGGSSADATDDAELPEAAPAEGGATAGEIPSPETHDLESLKSISDTVRVDIRKLDELMNLVGELVIQRNQIAALAARLASDPRTAAVGAELAKVHRGLDRKLKELQTGVLDVRMVPLRQVFEKLSRVVRRLRRDHDKPVRLEIKGADTELDKLIVEELVDPLVHVVRNAFDHAIEDAADREAAGKPVEGTIRLEAAQRGNHVVISVSDDGRGIDVAAVRGKAESQGLVAPEDLLSDKDVLDLVFAPGFSTRDEVTETSGRGVGMDVVRSNLTSLGGLVDLDSVPGRGTTVNMTLPITLAIVQALIVGVGRQRFAIPLNSVMETLLVEPGEIQRSEGREILNLRGEALPLRRLADEFGLGAPEAETRPYVVVLGIGDLRIGLVVDRLEGQQDTVIKPILGPIQDVRGITGATELGDQEAVLVVDVSAFVEDAVRRREAA